MIQKDGGGVVVSSTTSVYTKVSKAVIQYHQVK